MNISEFNHVIQPNKNLDELKQEILSKDRNFFTFDFEHAINDDVHQKTISINDFWKLAKVKAKKVSLFVDEILSCNVVESAPLGFIREITMPASDVTQGTKSDKNNTVHIRERVVVDDASKTLLFFQLDATGNILLYAINHVEEKNNNLYFTGHYVYSVRNNSTEKADQDFMKNSNQVLPERVTSMLARMKSLIYDGKLEEKYQSLYS